MGTRINKKTQCSFESDNTRVRKLQQIKNPITTQETKRLEERRFLTPKLQQNYL